MLIINSINKKKKTREFNKIMKNPDNDESWLFWWCYIISMLRLLTGKILHINFYKSSIIFLNFN